MFLQNNANWSLIILLTQIEKFQINGWISPASLPCIGCWFRSMVFMLAVFSIHQKEEFAFPVSLCSQGNLLKKSYSAANTKSNEWRCPILVVLVSLKSISLRFKKYSYFQLLSKKLLSFPEKMLQCLKIESFYHFLQNKRNNFPRILPLSQTKITFCFVSLFLRMKKP